MPHRPSQCFAERPRSGARRPRRVAWNALSSDQKLLHHSPILSHPPEQVRVVHHDTVFIHGKLGPEATAVEVLEKVEPVGQSRIGLRLWVHRQVWREDPGHVELPPLTDSHRLAAYREAVGERSWPDIDIYAAIELVDGPAIAVSPATPAVRLQTQRSGGPLRRDDQRGIAEPP